MQELEKLLTQEAGQLEKIIKVLEKRVEQYPEGKLQVCTSNGYVQYYYSGTTQSSGKQREYIRKDNMRLAQTLAQKDYEQKLLKNLKAKHHNIMKTCKLYKNDDYMDLYDQLHPERKKLVTPLYIPKDEYIKQWQDVNWQKKTFAEGTAEIYTVKGERVRSKSEKILADFFEREGIPYRYEYPVKLAGNQTIHPDFMLLNVRTRKEYFLEHLGMMDDSKYAADAVIRLEEMAKCGIVVGKNLLITMETKNHPLNMNYVRMLIEQTLY